MKICIDAGHYGKYNRSPVNKAYYESDMSWKLHNYLKSALQAYGITVVTTRPTQAGDLGLESRGKKAAGCDLFLSIHSNACGDATVDYPLACCCVSGKVDKLGQHLADKVHSVMGTRQTGRIIKKRGDGGDWYGVLRGAAAVGVPGILLEHSFHTNLTATNWLISDANLQKMAHAEADVIAAYYGIKKPAGTQTNKSTSTKYRTDWKQGEKVTITDQAQLFVSESATTPSKRLKGGVYYIYDGICCKNGRYRITTRADYCGKTPAGKYVTGYVSIDKMS